MPVYEYECKACGRDFEYQQRMSDPDKTTCEVCGGALDRLISRTAFSLKGGGWYKDLYASPKPEKADKSDKAAGTESAKSDGAAATTAKSDGGSTAGSSSTSTASSSSTSTASSGSSSGSGSSSAAAAKAT
ncbi:MAG TPA: zinc ribbon domain-containing protein [Kofleriaceae bacterium]